MIKYFIIYPMGRERLKADNRADAIEAFNNHWSAAATYYESKNGSPMVRRLIEERSEEIATDTDLNVVKHTEVEDEED